MPDRQFAIVDIVDKHRRDTSEAVQWQAWLQSHAELSETKQQLAKANVCKIAESMLPVDKVKTIKALSVPPFVSNEILQEAYDKLQAVTSGRNANSSISAAGSLEQKAWAWLNEYNVEAKFKTKAWELFKVAPNSLMVVDAPADGQGEPYIAYRDVSKLHAFKHEGQGNDLLYAIFKEDDKGEVFSVYTNEVYAKLIRVNGNWDYTETLHSLGRCPVRFMWTTPADSQRRWIKQTPPMNKLRALDLHNYHSIAFTNQVSTSIFPTLVTIPMSCGYHVEKNLDDGLMSVHQCSGGQLEVDGMITGEPCPSCKGKVLSGAGAVIKIPPVTDHTGQGVESYQSPDIKYIAPPITDVEFQYRKGKESHIALVASIAGHTSALADKVAINKAQVQQNGQSRDTILRNLSANFSAAQSWAIETLLQLKFVTQKIAYEASWGTEFFNYTESELVELIKQAQEAGLKGYEIELRAELMELRHSQNPDRKAREKILASVEPYSTLTLIEAQGISQDVYIRKLLFPEFIKSYEARNGRIGSLDIDEAALVNSIDSEFEKYVEPYLSKVDNEDDEDGTNQKQ